MNKTDTIIIRLVGDSGDGVQLVGEQLTITAALSGKEVRTLPDFPAEIRAPAGTMAGLSGYQLAISERAIFTAGETLDVLVALNPAALKNGIEYLRVGGLLLLNQDNFQTKDWQKAGVEPDFLENIRDQYQVLSIPLITQTRQTIEVNALEVSHAEAKKAKNFYILGLVLWLFDLPTTNCTAFIREKFKSNLALSQANSLSLLAGYNYAMTLELSRSQFILDQVDRGEGDYRLINGVSAVSLALASVTVKTQVPMLVSGYPITPASAILQEAASLSEYGISLLQAEDEIAAVCACMGAAFGGRLAMTCTSGPGFDLKSEGLGLGIMAELPFVLVNIQRAGPSTGLPTKTSQSDLLHALYGRHGEAPLPVLAARSPADCFYVTIEAFRIAVKYMTPVIVLLDASLANAAEPWKISDSENIVYPTVEFNRFPSPYERDEILSRSWNIPGTPGFAHRIGGLEKQGSEGRVSYEASNHQTMVELRAKKIAGIAREYPPTLIEGNKDTDCLIIGWGSTYGSLKAAVEQCSQEGINLALLHLRYLNPLPKDLKNLLSQYKKIIVAELNSGQLWQLIRANYLIDAKLIAQTNGLPFTASTLVKSIRSKINEFKMDEFGNNYEQL